MKNVQSAIKAKSATIELAQQVWNSVQLNSSALIYSGYFQAAQDCKKYLDAVLATAGPKERFLQQGATASTTTIQV